MYVTPQEAYEMWRADTDRVHILDVRTFEECIFVGHVESARNIPLVFPRYDPDGPSMPGRPPCCSGEFNPDFVAKVQEAFDPDDRILVMCATGGRGAMSVNLLAQARGCMGSRLRDGAVEGPEIDGILVGPAPDPRVERVDGGEFVRVE